MLALGLVALVVAAQNPFALIFILPSLHAWLWLPHASERGRPAALGVFAIGFVGPLLLLGSFAFRYGFGFDAVWYLTALTSVGYVPFILVIAFLAWAPSPRGATRPTRPRMSTRAAGRSASRSVRSFCSAAAYARNPRGRTKQSRPTTTS
jgi:hypothetical protein